MSLQLIQKKLKSQRWALVALYSGPWFVSVFYGRVYAETNGRVDTTIHAVVEVSPEPYGGKEAYLRQFLKDYQMPKEAIDAKVEGLLKINFVVERDGGFSRIAMPRNLGYGTAEEAIRLLKESQRWKPGLINGRPVRASLSFLFRIDGTNGYITRAKTDESDNEVTVEAAPDVSEENEAYQTVEVMPELPGTD